MRSIWHQFAVAALVIAGCSAESTEQAVPEADLLVTDMAEPDPAPPSSDAELTKTSNLPEFAQGWVLSFEGVGPLRVGMPEEEARAALGDDLRWPDPPEEGCDYGGIRGADGEVFFLVVDGRIARFDIRGHEIATAEGARVGNQESRIHQLYGEAVQVEPHKYTDGHYLIVPAPGDTARRMIFETHADTVTTFRSGARPVVDWVEGCA